MTSNKILYALKDEICVFRMNGDIRHTLSPGFDAVLNQVLSKTPYTHCIIDLRNTLYIDSTNLGLIARIANHAWENKQAKPIIVSCNQDVNAVLSSMGFMEVFEVIENYGPDSLTFQDTPDQAPPIEEKARLILESHKTLMNLNPSCSRQFKNVVETLEQDINRHAQ